MSSTINHYTGLPEHWSIKTSKTHKQEYFYNSQTKESTWSPPPESNTELLESYLSRNLHQPTKVRASHLLVKHKDSRRPSSWKEPNITRTKQEAIEILKNYQSKIKSGEYTLPELALDNSDCSSHAVGGDLGFFTKGQMQPSFEYAAFNLQVGELSDIVESDSGVHLILRTG